MLMNFLQEEKHSFIFLFLSLLTARKKVLAKTALTSQPVREYGTIE